MRDVKSKRKRRSEPGEVAGGCVLCPTFRALSWADLRLVSSCAKQRQTGRQRVCLMFNIRDEGVRGAGCVQKCVFGPLHMEKCPLQLKEESVYRTGTTAVPHWNATKCLTIDLSCNVYGAVIRRGKKGLKADFSRRCWSSYKEIPFIDFLFHHFYCVDCSSSFLELLLVRDKIKLLIWL